MAASNEWREWHLTPRGWEPGDVRYEGQDVEVTPPPGDRVLTYIYSEEIRSPVSARIEKQVTKIWPHHVSPEGERLLAEYGDCPREFSSAVARKPKP